MARAQQSNCRIIWRPSFARLLQITITLAILANPASAQSTQGHLDGLPQDYRLVWSDEFNAGQAPDPAKWSYDTLRNKEGWYNNEKEYYSADRRENARIENGHLVLEARKDDVSRLADYGGQAYSSARLMTRGKAEWTYGFFDVRAKLPCGVGQWPAIWLLGTKAWPAAGEIDIMEEVGFQPTTVYGTVHSPYSETQHVHQGDKTDVPDLCRAYHDYETDWRSDSITFLVDGKPFYRLDRPANATAETWPFDNPEFMILNVAVGGDWGGRHGIDERAFPAQMLIDYVRVYQK